jgi:glycosyltransferase involved in cell wall biosynthesis
MRFGVPGSNVRVFHDAPSPEAFHPSDQTALRARCGFAPEDIVLHYHGVMHQGKGIDKLIQWTADLRSEFPSIGLILVGAGPESAALQRLAQSCGISDRVHFTGWLKTTKEVGEYCCAADLCVAMRTGDESNVHIIPGALLHCMACGKVVLAPRLPGMEEVIRHGDNGFLFAADDGNSFKDLIRTLVARRAEWPRVAANAEREIRERYSVEATARDFSDAIMAFAKR